MPLRGFLTTADAENIKLQLQNASLEYEDVNAGENKQIKLRHESTVYGDPTQDNNIPEFSLTDQSFFTLTGVGSENYEIDRNSLSNTKLQGNVLKRPININLYTITKTYDGTTDINPSEIMYDITGTDSTSSGLIEGTSNVKNAYTFIGARALFKDQGLGYKVGDTFKIKLKELDVEGLPNMYQISGQPFTKNECKLTILEVSDIGEIMNFSMSPVFPFIYPVPYEISDETLEEDGVTKRLYGMTFTHGSDTYHTVTAQDIRNESDFGYNKTKSTIALEADSSVTGRGLKFTLYVKPEEIETGTKNTAIKYFIPSDIDKVKLSLEDGRIEYSSKHVTNEPVNLRIENPKLVGGLLGDASTNYEIASITGKGLITPAPLTVKIPLLSKTYDGTTDMKIDWTNPDALTYEINADIDLSQEEIRWNKNNIKLHTVSRHVGNTKLVNPQDTTDISTWFTGRDVNNYAISLATSNSLSATIHKKEVSISVKYIRFIISTGRFEILYNIEGVYSIDNVYIDLTGGIIVFDNNNTTSNVFVSPTRYDRSKFIYSKPSGSTKEIVKLEIETDEGNKLTVENGQKVYIGNINIAGDDAGNYELVYNTVEEITNHTNIVSNEAVPLYFVYTH